MSDLCPTCSNDPCICEKDAAIEQPQDVVINTFDNLAGRPDSATIESWKRIWIGSVSSSTCFRATKGL